MNLIKFPVSTTNIFPCSNSKAGGQYMTEFNLRSRESVACDPKVQYMIGPSFVHCEDDFKLSRQSDTIQAGGKDTDAVTSSTILEIAPGRGVINGHYIESLTPIQINMADVNARARANGEPALKGELKVGLRVMYSGLPTMMGAMLTENSEHYYEGIQVVILPPSEFKLPSSVYRQSQEGEVTAHLELGTIHFVNGQITSNVTNNKLKCQYIDASRIGNFDRLLSGNYISKGGLDPNKLYVYAGRGSWCEAGDALMVWDNQPEAVDQSKETIEIPADGTVWHRDSVSDAAHFEAANNGAVLVVPHKQIDSYSVESTAGGVVRYKDLIIDLPTANYMTGRAGIVDERYTKHIQEIESKINEIQIMPGGRQIAYYAKLDYTDDSNQKIRDLPVILADYEPGDYLVVAEDLTVDHPLDGSKAPSTLYLVCGKPTEVQPVSDTPSGRLIATVSGSDDPEGSGFQINKHINLSIYRANTDDYFTYQFNSSEGTTYHHFKITAIERCWSDPIFLTGSIPLAQEEVIGGFLNVPEDTRDGGYVYRDQNGHLRLADYALLRSGTLAYQLGEDFTTPANITNEEVQHYLDEYVNQRIAFPNLRHSQEAKNPNMISVNVNLPKNESNDPVVINIYDIDSRFATGVEINILGEADANTIINISDCQRVKIGVVAGTPEINLYRSCLYYDAQVMERINIIRDLSLWYSRFEREGDDDDTINFSPNLRVDGLSVEQYNESAIAEQLTFWDEEDASGDNHLLFALKGITFDPSGNIVGCKLLVKNNSATDAQSSVDGDYLAVFKFALPAGLSLSYPKKRLEKPIKVSGSFITAYQSNGSNNEPEGAIVQKVTFSVVTQTYRPETDLFEGDIVEIPGTATILSETKLVTSVLGVTFDQHKTTKIEGVSSDDWHVFEGGAIT